MIRYEPCPLSEAESFGDYLASLSSPMESFFEDHILESEFYRILSDSQEIGSFAVLESLLTQFHIVGQARGSAQQVLAGLLKDFPITAAFVPTFDEFLLCQALDAYVSMKLQAHFFTDGSETRAPAILADLEYRLAKPSDVVEIKSASGDFLDAPDEDVAKGKIHMGSLRDELVTIGIIEKGRILKQHASIGMFTKETHRQKGIGTATILYLKGVCREQNIVPLAGCGYDNHNSKKTLESAGMIASSRLLQFEFKGPE